MHKQNKIVNRHFWAKLVLYNFGPKAQYSTFDLRHLPCTYVSGIDFFFFFTSNYFGNGNNVDITDVDIV